ncbi:MAG: exodeoxyribonuclease III [Thermoplasmata archaeon]
MKISITSWNVNGIRAALKNGLLETLKKIDADIVCLQEVKADESTLPEEIRNLGYSMFINPAEKKGYSGTLTLSRSAPLSVVKGMGSKKFDSEGRVLALEFQNFWVINAYFPNSQRGLTRLDYKLEYNRNFEKWAENLRKTKPLVICGDLNVAHDEIDIARPKENEMNAGFTVQERNWMTEFLSRGYLDTFRMFNREGGNYTWWSYRFNAREKNIGWRIDYFIVSHELEKNVVSSSILSQLGGSDHAPIKMELAFP